VNSPIRAIIETDALRHNLRRVCALAPGSRIMAVIKANAYGHGLEVAAGALADADGFAVARLEEGRALRASGFSGRILLLEGVFSVEQLASAVAERFDLMVHGFEQLSMLEQRSGAAPVTVWLKLDTGMNRLGFRSDEFAEAYARLRRVPGLAGEPTLVTHLASADERANPQTSRQLEAFAALTAGLPGERSVANSAGILGWPAARGGWVRPGLMLYGASPLEEGCGRDLDLRPVMTFETAVIGTRRVPPGERVGYGGTWCAARDTRLAIAAAGYGDGYPRSARSGTPVLVNGQRASLAGRVSMDMLAVDVTDLPPVAVGDPVVLWGARLAVEEVARCADTIPYQLTCAVSPRVPHVVR
jgi:alanine racemase